MPTRGGGVQGMIRDWIDEDPNRSLLPAPDAVKAFKRDRKKVITKQHFYAANSDWKKRKRKERGEQPAPGSGPGRKKGNAMPNGQTLGQCIGKLESVVETLGVENTHAQLDLMMKMRGGS